MSHDRPAPSDAMEGTPPLVMGGQGRSSADVESSAGWLAWLTVLWVVAVLFASAVAFAGGIAT